MVVQAPPVGGTEKAPEGLSQTNGRAGGHDFAKLPVYMVAEAPVEYRKKDD